MWDNLQPLHRGVDVILSINSKIIGGQTNADLTRTMSPIKVTNKINGDWEKSLAGVKSWKLTCKGFIVKDELSFQELENSFNSGLEVSLSLNDGVKTYTGNALITNFPVAAPYDDNFSYDITFLGVSELTINEQE